MVLIQVNIRYLSQHSLRVSRQRLGRDKDTVFSHTGYLQLLNRGEISCRISHSPIVSASVPGPSEAQNTHVHMYVCMPHPRAHKNTRRTEEEEKSSHTSIRQHTHTHTHIHTHSLTHMQTHTRTRTHEIFDPDKTPPLFCTLSSPVGRLLPISTRVAWKIYPGLRERAI